jgi:flagellar basal body-associated protein FliL
LQRLPERDPGPRGAKQFLIMWAAIVLLAVAIGVLTAYVVVLKNAHDTEQQRTEQQIRLNNCALLDQLPANFPLNNLRATYHCGPGLPETRPRP